MQHRNPQRLYWSISEPFKYMGMAIDEIVFLALVLSAAIVCLLTERLIILAALIAIGVVGCVFLKKWKNIQKNFRWKSFLVARKLWPAPSGHPKMLNKKRVGH